MMKNVERTTPIVKLNLKLPRSSLCDYSDPYILVKGSILIAPRAGDNANNNNNNNNNKVASKNCVLFTDCISEISHTQIDNAKYTDVIMPVYNLIEYNNSYSKTLL